MPTLTEICDSVAQMAGNIGGRPVVVDEPTVELLFPIVLQKIILDAKDDSGKIKNLIKTHSVSISNGVGVLPTGVMPEFFDSVELFDTEDDPTLVSYIRNYSDFARGSYSVFNYFTIAEGKIYYKNNISDNNSQTVSFKAVTMPTLPANGTDQLLLPSDILEELKIELVRAFRGESPYMNLGEEEKFK